MQQELARTPGSPTKLSQENALGSTGMRRTPTALRQTLVTYWLAVSSWKDGGDDDEVVGLA